MGLSITRYIQASSVRDITIRFKWDDWNVEQAEEPIDEKFEKRLQGISQRAVVAFTAGTAEWIVYRFGALSDDPLPWQYLEAAWAQVVNWQYGAVSWEDYTTEKEWTGPIRGPLGTAMTRVMYAIERAQEDEDPELRGAWITNLARHVMTDPTNYLSWREAIMRRLETLYRRNPNETLGEVVPREALEPESDFRIEQTEGLVNRFLAGADHRSNPFLNSPEKMVEEGFEGKPYVFNIEQDRRSRLEW